MGRIINPIKSDLTDRMNQRVHSYIQYTVYQKNIHGVHEISPHYRFQKDSRDITYIYMGSVPNQSQIFLRSLQGFYGYLEKCDEALSQCLKSLVTDHSKSAIVTEETIKIIQSEIPLEELRHRSQYWNLNLESLVRENSDSDYIDHLQQAHLDYIDQLSSEARKALDYYTGNGYEYINNYLRGILKYTHPKQQHDDLTERQMLRLINQLNQILINAPEITRPIVIYRGLKLDQMNLFKNLQEHMILDIFRDAYNSCSFDLSRGTHHHFSGDRCCTFILHLPAGVRGLYVGPRSTLANEEEFILAPGPFFRLFRWPEETNVPISNKFPWFCDPDRPKLKCYHLAGVNCEVVYQRFQFIASQQLVGQGVAIGQIPKNSLIAPFHPTLPEFNINYEWPRWLANSVYVLQLPELTTSPALPEDLSDVKIPNIQAIYYKNYPPEVKAQIAKAHQATGEQNDMIHVPNEGNIYIYTWTAKKLINIWIKEVSDAYDEEPVFSDDPIDDVSANYGQSTISFDVDPFSLVNLDSQYYKDLSPLARQDLSKKVLWCQKNQILALGKCLDMSSFYVQSYLEMLKRKYPIEKNPLSAEALKDQHGSGLDPVESNGKPIVKLKPKNNPKDKLTVKLKPKAQPTNQPTDKPTDKPIVKLKPKPDLPLPQPLEPTGANPLSLVTENPKTVSGSKLQFLDLDYGTYHGEVKNGIPHGQGQLVHINGTIYKGEFANGEPQGNGQKIYQNGTIYSGEFADGEPNGLGQQIQKYGDPPLITIYKGNFQHGLPYGQGQKTYPNGDIYIGQFVNGVIHGKGELIAKPKPGEVTESYNGGWSMGVKHGQGIETKTENGQITTSTVKYEKGIKVSSQPIGSSKPWELDDGWYQGMINSQNGLPEGKGHLTYKYENHVYEGQFRNGVPEGAGKMYLDGDLYEGEFRDGEFEGQGTYTKANGDYYQGGWSLGVKHGNGQEAEAGVLQQVTYMLGEIVSSSSNGLPIPPQPIQTLKIEGYATQTYIGSIINGKPEGKGQMIYDDGSVYSGDFHDGLPHGIGRAQDLVKPTWIYEGEFTNDNLMGFGKKTHANGDFYDGEWKNGYRDGCGIEKIAGQTYRVEYYLNKKVDEDPLLLNLGGGQKPGSSQLLDPLLLTPVTGTYIGLLKDGKPHSHGRLDYSSGWSYIGHFRDGLPHGNGRLIQNCPLVLNGKLAQKYKVNYLNGQLLQKIPMSETIRCGQPLGQPPVVKPTKVNFLA